MTALPVRHFEDVAVGDSLPVIELAATLTRLVMYAGATWDFHRYHYDAAFIEKLGMPAPFMDGQMVGALLSRLVMQWAGGNAFMRRLSYRQRAMVYLGDAIAISGRVTGTDVSDGRPLVGCSLWVTKSDGTAVVRDATALVELTRKSG